LRGRKRFARRRMNGNHCKTECLLPWTFRASEEHSPRAWGFVPSCGHRSRCPADRVCRMTTVEDREMLLA